MTIEEMKKRKKELGYSFRQLSELTGLPLGTIQKVFNGETKAPRYQTLHALERVLAPDRNHGMVFQYADPVSPSVLRERAAVYRFEKDPPSFDKTEYALNRDGFLEGPYTYDDYEKLPDDRQKELIHGVFYDMSSPRYSHQMIQANLIVQFTTELQKNGLNCDVVGPVDTLLEENDKTVVQPDLSVICHPDPERIHDGKIWGAPDLIVEILSPSTRSRDMNLKLQLYRHAGVREYWMIDPDDRILFQIVFQAKDILTIHKFKEKVDVAISGGKIRIDLKPLLGIVNSPFA